MDMKMRLKRIESGMTGGRINVGSFSKDWKCSGMKIFKKVRCKEDAWSKSLQACKKPQSVSSLAECVLSLAEGCLSV